MYFVTTALAEEGRGVHHCNSSGPILVTFVGSNPCSDTSCVCDPEQSPPGARCSASRLRVLEALAFQGCYEVQGVSGEDRVNERGSRNLNRQL